MEVFDIHIYLAAFFLLEVYWAASRPDHTPWVDVFCVGWKSDLNMAVMGSHGFQRAQICQLNKAHLSTFLEPLLNATSDVQPSASVNVTFPQSC